jgi:hypothetical protein
MELLVFEQGGFAVRFKVRITLPTAISAALGV